MRNRFIFKNSIWMSKPKGLVRHSILYLISSDWSEISKSIIEKMDTWIYLSLCSCKENCYLIGKIMCKIWHGSYGKLWITYWCMVLCFMIRYFDTAVSGVNDLKEGFFFNFWVEDSRIVPIKCNIHLRYRAKDDTAFEWIA